MKNKNSYTVENIKKSFKKNEIKLSIIDKKRKQFHTALKKEFPILWRAPENNTQELDDYAKPTCDIGWQKVIWETSQKLSELIEQIKEIFPREQLPIAVQVKEKFGLLRFYVDGNFANFPEDFTKKFHSIVTDAENESAITCEICAQEGFIKNIITNHKNKFTLVKTLCKNCFLDEREKALMNEIYVNTISKNQSYVDTLIKERESLLETIKNLTNVTSNKETANEE
jgi:hypothetical protein